MPGPPLSYFAPPDAIPDCVDVVVVGGGVIGLFSALELAERGHRVALCEKGNIGAEQSSRNWGWVRAARRDPRELALAVESQRMWHTLDKRLGAKTGYRACGIVFTADSEAQKSRLEAWCRHAREYQLNVKMLGKRELQQHFPGTRLDSDSALLCGNDGFAEPQWVAPAVAARCRELGVTVLPNCAVRTVSLNAGNVVSIATEHGEIGCNAAVVAAGAWSSLFCRNLGVSFPQLKVMSSALRTEPSALELDHALWTSDFSVRKRADGAFTIASGHRSVVDIVPDSFRFFQQFLPALKSEWSSLSFRAGSRTLKEWRQASRWSSVDPSPFEAERILDPVPAEHLLSEALEQFKQFMPQAQDIRIAQSWAGMIDVTPDALPVISAVDKVPGLYIASGFSGHGFGVAPAAGHLMADLITGQPPLVDAQAFRLSRFSDGSAISLQ